MNFHLNARHIHIHSRSPLEKICDLQGSRYEANLLLCRQVQVAPSDLEAERSIRRQLGQIDVLGDEDDLRMPGGVSEV